MISPPSNLLLSRYVVGVDLGRQNDPTAIAIVRRDEFQPEIINGYEVSPPAVFRVGYLERLPLGTPYPGVVRHVARLLQRPSLAGGSDLVLDQTGVGVAVVDMFRSAGMDPIGVMIHGGESTVQDGMTFRVPKLALVSRLQTLFSEDRLHIHRQLADATALKDELINYEAQELPSGRMTFNAPSGRHDDLVMALAIAVWRAHGVGCQPHFLTYMAQECAELQARRGR